jgi:L-iditol 2-dehydrogenase
MGTQMLAAVYHGPGDLRVEERPRPEVGPGEALLKVVSAGVCGTDLRILHGDHRKVGRGVERVPGHEVVGEIAALGSGIAGLTLGQRVFVAPNWGCGRCEQCVSGNNNRCADYGALGITTDGGFAQYMRVPAPAIAQGNIIPLAPGLDAAAAALIEPFACVLRGQDSLRVGPGEVVLIIGAGPIGVMHVLLARLRGAGRVIVSDVAPERLPAAERAGADRVVDPIREDLGALVLEESQGRGADAVIVAAPSGAAMSEAPGLAAIGGRISYFAGLPREKARVELDANLIHYKELHVTGTTGCSTHDCWRAAALVNTGRVDLSGLVSARFGLLQAATAFAAAEGRHVLKVVIEP